MTYIDAIMLELAERGSAVLTTESGFYLEDVREAAREDGVQVRFKEYDPSTFVITLRKAGRGH
jgi:hypothetical protein